MENDDPFMGRVLRSWTRPPGNDTSRSLLGDKTAKDDEENDDDDDDVDNGRISPGRPFDVSRRSSSFEDASTSSESSGPDAISHQSRIFPPTVGIPILVQSRRPPGQTSTPQTSEHPFGSLNALRDFQGRNMASYPDGSAGSRRPPIYIPPGSQRAGLKPSYTLSSDSESSFSEVEGSAVAESITSLSKTQTRSLPPRAEPQNDDQNPLHFDPAYTSEPDGDNEFLPGKQDTDPLKIIWRKLFDKKSEVLRKRDKIRKARGKLKRARIDKDLADNAFMSCLRPLLVDGPVPSSGMAGLPLDQRFLRMQQTRDQCQECETLLESLEDKLDQAEQQLDKLERQLINELRAAPTHPLEPIASDLLPLPPDQARTFGSDHLVLPDPVEATGSHGTTTMPEELLGIAAERSEDYHPLYNQFMSVIGYFQLAQEHHIDLCRRKQSIEEEQERLRLAEEQEREQWRLTEEQKRLRLAKKHEQARQRLAEEQERQCSRLAEEHQLELSRLDEETLRSSSPLQVRKLRDEDLEFLRDFEVDEKIAAGEVWRLRYEVEQFKQVCQEKHVIPHHAPLHEAYSYERDYEDDISIDFDPQKDADPAEFLANPRFPLLLSNPSHLMGDHPVTAKTALKQAAEMPPSHPNKAKAFGTAAKEFFIESLVRDAKENDKADFINRWLLHKLRTSPLEAELLSSCFFMESHLKILNTERWQQDVLYYWPRDDAAKLRPEDFIGPVTPEATQLRVGSSEIAPGTRQSQRVDPYDEPTSASLF